MKGQKQVLGLLSVLIILAAAGNAQAQMDILPNPDLPVIIDPGDLKPNVISVEQLDYEVFFSTEEDFMMQRGEPADGDPYISDGDLLSSAGYILMRNAQLLQPFDVTNDLGLDAVDVLTNLDVNYAPPITHVPDANLQRPLIAFSTSLDSPHGQFTAGDLLFTNGVIIPNAALLSRFGIPRGLDLGLDAVHISGTPDQITTFINRVKALSLEQIAANPGTVAQLLETTQVDILFSTEGTAPANTKVRFLDGDLLSARTGTIILENENALPPVIPAGIPNRGVDFGMDAVTAFPKITEQMGNWLFSTEINGRFTSFTDGDAMMEGNGAVLTNFQLVGNFYPRVKDMGLDAISLRFEGPQGTACGFTKIGGIQVTPAAYDFVTGLADPNASGRKDHAFAYWVSIRGKVSPGTVEHRVVVRETISSANLPIVMDSSLNWQVPTFGIFTEHLYTDANGWMDTSKWQNLIGDPTSLIYNPDLIMVAWNTRGKLIEEGTGNDAGPFNGTYYLVLQVKDGSGNVSDCQTIPIQIDNITPITTVSGEYECNELTLADLPIPLEAAMHDGDPSLPADQKHYWGYSLTVQTYGNPEKNIGTGFYYDASKPLNEFGTDSYPAMQQLGQLTVADLFTDADGNIYDGRYTIGFYAYDRAMRGYFYPSSNTMYDFRYRHWKRSVLNFEIHP